VWWVAGVASRRFGRVPWKQCDRQALAGSEQGRQMKVLADARGAHRTFPVLDLLRGIAAIAVLGRHFGRSILDVFPNSYLAVDLFFMLSGFVMANAYEHRLSNGLSLRAFARIRVVRLYPMYALGTLLSVFAMVAFGLDGPINWHAFVVGIGCAVFFIPALAGLSFDQQSLFPFNRPAWSLWFELAINALYAVIARWLSWRVLVFVLCVGLVLLASLCASHGNLDAGWRTTQIFSGLSRILFSYFAGVAIFRLRKVGVLGRLALSPVLAAIVLLFTFALRFDVSAISDFLIVVVVFPLLIAASTNDPGSRADPVFRWLGAVSYPLYATQGAYVGAVRRELDRIGGQGQWKGYVIEVAVLAMAAVGAWLVSIYVDGPIRSWLTKRDAARHPDGLNVAGGVVTPPGVE
jgi:peptidoglycan/LPS O-acetylase OafA/YrhL